ncbi:MAG TPA: ABC transporter substrate-binding protein [Roseiflexaceae bacterium]|nr:ABC transporter substrate-binding protein [Roseiflexaceae bacterium]
MRQKSFSFAALLVLLSLILAACGGNTNPSGGQGGTTPTQGTTAPTAAGTGGTDATAAAPTAGAEQPTAGTEQPTAGAEQPTAGAGAEPTQAAPSGVTVPDVAGLRNDLSGVTIKAILSANENVGPALDELTARKFTELTGINVELILGEKSATDRLAIYNQQLNANSSDVDVYMVDVIWPGILATYAEDLKPLVGDLPDFFPAIVANNTVDGKLVAVPYYTDAGLLYYRKDLLEKYGYSNPPATWTELEEMAKKIQDGERASNPDFWGFVWQGKAYEGLTCNALEWQVSNGGGSIVEPDGTISVNNEQVIGALNRVKGWVGTISPQGVTTYQEEEARGVWQAGNAAFMRNWPYAFSLGQAADSAIKDKFDVAPLPKGDGPDARNADTLGGWQLMLNKNSQNKEAAAEFIKFLTSPEIQKFNSLQRSLLPTRPAIYDDPEVLAANAYYGPLKAVFSGGAVARPSTVTADLYNDVSVAYFTSVNQVLTGQAEAGAAMADLERKLEQILR